MARKELTYTAEDGRDKGKIFYIQEMPAAKAERWAMRALLALMKSGVDIGDGFEKLGMAGMAEVGLRAVAGLEWSVAEPLLDEMMECVQFIPDKKKLNLRRGLVEEDIEEVQTRLKLRMEVWKLHVDFFKSAAS